MYVAYQKYWTLKFAGKPFKKPSSIVSQQHKKKRKRQEDRKEPTLIPINQFISQACMLTGFFINFVYCSTVVRVQVIMLP